jgi:hypothetical protein
LVSGDPRNLASTNEVRNGLAMAVSLSANSTVTSENKVNYMNCNPRLTVRRSSKLNMILTMIFNKRRVASSSHLSRRIKYSKFKNYKIEQVYLHQANIYKQTLDFSIYLNASFN